MSVDPKPSGWTSHHSGGSHRAVRSMFGQTLRQLYEVPRQTPHQLLVILMQLGEGKVDGPLADGEEDR
jgi:hypothetical protein